MGQPFSFLGFSYKVRHSSAFQKISRRSMFIKINNYSDSISANLNKQFKQNNMRIKKTAFLF